MKYKIITKLKALALILLVATGPGASAQQKNLLWKISGPDLKEPSYLFGTMHTADARVVSLGDKIVKPYFATAKAYAMELDPDAKGFDMSLLSKLMMGKGYSLHKMIPAKEYGLLDSVVTKEVGFSMSLFDNIAPIYVMTIFESMSMGLTDSSIAGNSQVLDLYLYKKAKDDKKKIIGIETASEQLDALGALSYQEQAELLVQEVDSFQKNNTVNQTVLKYYLSQDLDSLAATDNDAGKSDKFYKAMVLDRNARMAERISGFVKKQSTFIAVGALHLPGEKGIIELLRKKGLTVEPVS